MSSAGRKIAAVAAVTIGTTFILTTARARSTRPIARAKRHTGDPDIARALATHARRDHRNLAAFIYDNGAVRFGGLGTNEHAEIEIGSLTKTFNAELVRQLEEERKLKPDTTVGEIISVPGSPIATVTLRELLNHTSGLGTYGTPGILDTHIAPWLDLLGFYKRRSPTAVLASVSRLRLRNRGQFRYSNVGHALLGQLLAHHQDTPYEKLVRSRIFEPAGMRNSYIAIPGTAKDAPRGTRADGRPSAPWEEFGWAPAGAAHSTASDMAKFVHWVARHGGPGDTWQRYTNEGEEFVFKGGATAGYTNAVVWDTSTEGWRAAYVANSSWFEGGDLEVELLRLDERRH